ncbi:unnamed protein product [Nyctereutes procyonoides]|uniref:(raccoon dog) hypothetical protein n=1 Tax=Nyctereutes procyonoides TaxID=34880 RepID=A0A811YCV8_NYCPR|nr:unnamed protein product [Nyctereutes procyonoides]
MVLVGGVWRHVDTDPTEAQPAKRPIFPLPTGHGFLGGKEERSKIPGPANRHMPFKENWTKRVTPIVEHSRLQVRFTLKLRNVEIRTCKEMKDVCALTEAVSPEALALVRWDDLFLESLEITDVKPVKGDHLSRAIGRISGKGETTKFLYGSIRAVLSSAADQF